MGKKVLVVDDDPDVRSFVVTVLEAFKGKKVPEPDIYLEKPVEPQELVDAIRKKLE